MLHLVGEGNYLMVKLCILGELNQYLHFTLFISWIFVFVFVCEQLF